jgi:DNA-directed DNA polymerase III PolC
MIVHLDADAFFASVEQAADARLRGKPVAVGGEKRGIIASASYEARKCGIYTPMPTVRARKLCPKLIILPGDFEKYEQFSRWMFSYAYDFTPDVEISSIDEGYLDLTRASKSPAKIADTIRRAVREALKISISEGIASNKLVSQIASKLHKPAAFVEVPMGGEKPFLHPLANKWLPGVGPKTAMRLDAAGLAWIGQIAATPLELLHLLMGNSARQLKEYANGKDDRPIQPVSEPAKSYSQQETFAGDTTDEEYVQAVLYRQADHLMAKVRLDAKSIRTVTVKVRYNDMDEDQCSESLLEPTDLETDIYSRLRPMLRRAWRRRVSLRMVSLKVSNVYEGSFRGELPLEERAQQHEARRRLAEAVDELRKTRGTGVILRGHDFVLDRPLPSSDQEKGCVLRDQVATPSRVLPSIPRSINPSIRAAVPLAVHSYYSFLDSTLSIDAIIELARRHKLPAIALTDSGNLHGAVEFAQAAKAAGIKPIIGATTKFQGKPVRLYVQNAKGYTNLCRILSLKDLNPGVTDGLIAVSPDPDLAPLFPGRFYLEISDPAFAKDLHTSRQRFGVRLWPSARTSAAFDLPAIATLPVHYATPADRQKYDIVQSIRTLTLLRQEHPEKNLSGDFHFRSPREMTELFGEHPQLLANTFEIADRCNFEFSLGEPQFPAYLPPGGVTTKNFLRQLVFAGAQQRYGSRAPVPQIEQELAIIGEVGYEEYFLVVWDLLQECRRRGIEWLTRGSAADSLVCYCLGISNVCPIRFDLYFRRFLNKDRMKLKKLPDIDIDFAHDRKDDVIDLIFEKYGPEHTAVVGGFSTYQARGAVADVGKVLGVSDYQIRRFTEHFPWTGAEGLAATLKNNLECRDLPIEEEPYSTALQMAEFLDGFPRYAKMHPCGVVLSRQPMAELTPTFVSNKGYPTTHYDMDAVEALGLVKIDILAQGGLAVMRDVKNELAKRGDSLTQFPSTLGPWEDPVVWEMIASGQARAVHHIESPAMVSLCRMCNVHEIDGLVAIVSVIRPGAANEQKKTRFIRRYQGLEPVTYPHPSLEPCLKSTFGLVVYEEHILQICEAFAGLPAGRADVLRRALGKVKQPLIDEIQKEFFAAALARGHSLEKTTEVWELVSSFAGYAFCKAHSAAYGVEAYQSAWLKKYYPAEFMAAVLSNGKGFYHPLVYVLECHRLGIPMRPPWVNQPGPAFTVLGIDGLMDNGINGKESNNPTIHPSNNPPTQAIRIPVTRVKGLGDKTKDRLLAEFARAPFQSVRNFYQRVGPSSEEMEALIRVGAFDDFGQTRTAQFWEYQAASRSTSQLSPQLPFDNGGQGWLLPPPKIECPPEVREPTRRERLLWETELLDFPASGHPLELHDNIAWETYCPVSRLGEFVGQEVVTCGLVIEQRVHHQVTGEPMKFLTLVDWTGIVETELFAATYRNYGLATVRYPVLEITARVEPFENGRGHSLRVMRAGKPREIS